MIECSMTQDILKYKSKFVGGFSAREAVFLMIGACVGIFGFFTLFSEFELNQRVICTGIIAAPILVFGFMRPFDQPMEKVLLPMIEDNFLAPPIRKKEIHHPEFEKYEKQHPVSSIEKGGRNKSQKKEFHVKASKEYKAIR